MDEYFRQKASFYRQPKQLRALETWAILIVGAIAVVLWIPVLLVMAPIWYVQDLRLERRLAAMRSAERGGAR